MSHLSTLLNPRRLQWLAAAGAVSLGFLGTVSAQQSAPADTGLQVIRVQPNFYMIAGAGGNIGVQIGPDGVVVVDSGNAANASAVVAAIKKLTPNPIRYIINTNADPDHVGGNEVVVKAGKTLFTGGPGGQIGNAMNNAGAASVIGSEAVLNRMSGAVGDGRPYPAVAWPSESFTRPQKSLYLNGEGIAITLQPAAHSDGDSFVFFRRSDVIVAGDILDTTRYPVIDMKSGGTLQGVIAALNRLVDLAIPAIPLPFQPGGTQIIPGHGRICEQADVVEYRDMVTIVRDVVQDMINRGMTLEQIQSASPTKAYDGRYGSTSGPWTTRMFVEAVYTSLTTKRSS